MSDSQERWEPEGEPRATIIIPNYNGLKFMEPCFAALDKQTCRDFSLLVVDNGSTDGSVEWLKENQVPSIFLSENTGFSGAVNVGIREAKTPYVILLNNDTEPEPAYVEELVRAMDRSEKIFSVSSKMIQLYQKDKMDDAGDMYTVLGWAYQRGVGRPSRKYRRFSRVFSACAGAAIYRREVFEKIGFFDEMHFAYLEDLDIGYRARLAGYDNVYCPKAVVYHVGSGTSGSKYNSFKVRLAARNNIYLNYKNMPDWQLALNALPILLGMAVKYRFFRGLGFEKDYVDGVKEGWKTRKKCKRAVDNPGMRKHCLSIEGELIAGTFLYVWEFFNRKVLGR